jgi:tripartite-type tricarboxylate transporter receptor subunit TctC
LVSNADTHAINPFIYRRLPYDPERSFAPVSLFARVPFAMIIGRSQQRVTDFPSLVAAAKATPGHLTFASWGVGSASHLAMERIMRAVGIELEHVPFTGQAPGMQAVAAGQVDAMVLPAGGAEALARDGLVRVVVAASEERLEILPAVPTLREVGVDLTTGNWFAFHVPARTPDAAVRRLAQLTAEAVRDPRTVEVFRAQATRPEAKPPEELASFVTGERERWGAVVRAAGVSLD